MDLIWGVFIIIVGALMLIGGTLKSDFVVYRLLVARSKMIWGDKVHTFYQVAGLLVMFFGILLFTGIL